MTSYDNSSKYSNLGFTGDSIIRVPAPVLVEHQRHKKEKYESNRKGMFWQWNHYKAKIYITWDFCIVKNMHGINDRVGYDTSVRKLDSKPPKTPQEKFTLEYYRNVALTKNRARPGHARVNSYQVSTCDGRSDIM